MNRYEASVLNKITERHGPGWTIAALLIIHRWWLGGAGVATVAISKWLNITS